MAMCASYFVGVFLLLWSLTFAEKLTPEQSRGKSNHENDSIQPRFLPFSASFSLSSGGLTNNAHSLNVGGGNDGISFSQSTSQSGASNWNEGSGISASQSSSFAAGLSGISASDSNAFSVKHPAFGGNSQANSNSFALGQANSAAHGNVVNGQATSGAQSGVGSSHSSASSGASSSVATLNSNGQNTPQSRPGWSNVEANRQIGGLYNTHDGRPKLYVTQGSRGSTHRLPARKPIRLDVDVGNTKWQQRRPEVIISGYRGHRQGATAPGKTWSFEQQTRPSTSTDAWTQNPLNGPNPGSWSQSHRNENEPGLQVSGASASSSASSNAVGGSAQSHSSSQSSFGPNGPSSSTNNRVHTSGDAQSQAQGGAAAIGQHSSGSTQGSFSSSAIAGTSQSSGNSFGSAVSNNRGQSSQGQVTSHATGISFAQGTANAGAVNHVRFPDSDSSQNLPTEFVRVLPTNSRDEWERRKSRTRNPVGEIFMEISDTVADIFDI
ncbi:secreted protein C-like isoform X2 [Venturia canescens]|uniref:secreted protein C-like isoform X2 n=1 Tax=Venturia canescens TaxID=32260 RepID=UPI001C9BD091|nr:secreted protein C-like isoform X2 [Venturia canescens]